DAGEALAAGIVLDRVGRARGAEALREGIEVRHELARAAALAIRELKRQGALRDRAVRAVQQRADEGQHRDGDLTGSHVALVPGAVVRLSSHRLRSRSVGQLCAYDIRVPMVCSLCGLTEKITLL